MRVVIYKKAEAGKLSARTTIDDVVQLVVFTDGATPITAVKELDSDKIIVSNAGDDNLDAMLDDLLQSPGIAPTVQWVKP